MLSSPCFTSLIILNIIILFYNLSKFVSLFGVLGILTNKLILLYGYFFSTYKNKNCFMCTHRQWLFGFLKILFCIFLLEFLMLFYMCLCFFFLPSESPECIFIVMSHLKFLYFMNRLPKTFSSEDRIQILVDTRKP